MTRAAPEQVDGGPDARQFAITGRLASMTRVEAVARIRGVGRRSRILIDQVCDRARWLNWCTKNELRYRGR